MAPFRALLPPATQFSAEWLDSEPGRNRQVLARRWLTGAGHLQVSALEQPGELWLRLMLPDAGDRHELVLVEDSSQPDAKVRTGCGGVEVRLTGAGSHDTVLPVDPGAGEGGCTVEIVPDFYLLQLESGERRTLSLSGLAWSDGPAERPLDIGP